jgi:transposase, IS5 family
MKQRNPGLDLSHRKTRKRLLLVQMEHTAPWNELLAFIAPEAPVAKSGLPQLLIKAMLCIHFLLQWFGLSDVVTGEALFDGSLYRDLPDRAA